MRVRSTARLISVCIERDDEHACALACCAINRSRACYFCATARRRAPSSPPSNRTSNQISRLSIAAKKACDSHTWFLRLVSFLQLYPYNERELVPYDERERVRVAVPGRCVRCLFFLSRPPPRQRHALPPPAAPQTHADLSLLGQNQKSGEVGSSPAGNTTTQS